MLILQDEEWWILYSRLNAFYNTATLGEVYLLEFTSVAVVYSHYLTIFVHDDETFIPHVLVDSHDSAFYTVSEV